MKERLRSFITRAPVSYAVYSAFAFYATRRGGELPGPWIVRALTELGHEEGSIRQTLYRMEADREIEGSRTGRVKRYRLTPFARAEVQAGTAKIFERPHAWDGEWTLIHFRFESGERLERERVRSILQVEGYAALGPGLFIHPMDTARRVRQAVAELGLKERLFVMRGQRQGEPSDGAFVRQYWAIDELASGYQRFLREFAAVERTLDRVSDREAFALRLAVVLAFLEIAWNDPGLPAPLLPRGWPGDDARRLARALYERLVPRAIAYGDTIPGSTKTRPAIRAATATGNSQ